jgi:hypothetical protein
VSVEQELSHSLDSQRIIGQHIVDLLFSVYGCILIYLIFLISSPKVLSWNVVPIFLCGCIIGKDGVRWLRGKTDLFDPVGIIGIFGVYFFYVAPLLNISQNYWLGYTVGLDLPQNWFSWLGGIGLLNLIGIVLYQTVLYVRMSNGSKSDYVKWEINGRRARLVIPIALLVALVTQIFIYKKYGGISGFIQQTSLQSDAFTGMGANFALAASFPIVFMMGFTLLARKKPGFRKRKWLAVVLMLYLGLQMFFGGLSGSRSATVWALFWAVGLIHYWLKPVRKKTIAIGLVILFAFMYVYGFYKDVGVQAFQMIGNPAAVSEFQGKTYRSVDFTLLEDFARSDVQAYLLYRLNEPGSDYQLAMGRTYIGALASIIPHAIWPDRPPTKEKEGTEIQYGAYDPPLVVSHRVYGLAGETMLNFGYAVVPFAFILFGVVVKRCRKFILGLPADDARLLLAPYLTNVCIICLMGDSDNIMYFLVKEGLVPLLVVWLISLKVKVRAGGQSLDLSPTRLQSTSLRKMG